MKYIFIALASLLLTTECSLAEYKLSRESQYLMGTLFEISIYSTDDKLAKTTLSEAFALARKLDQTFSNYKPNNELAKINSLLPQQSLTISKDMYELLIIATEAYYKTNTNFNINYQGSSFKDFQLSNRSITRVGDKLNFDFGGIAKGYTVDKVTELLRSKGLRKALINLGSSSIYALGSPPGQTNWQLVVDAQKFRLKNQAISVSSSQNDEKQFHIFKPSLKKPLRKKTKDIKVSDSAVWADILSTAYLLTSG